MHEGGKMPSYKIEAKRHGRWASAIFLGKPLLGKLFYPGILCLSIPQEKRWDNKNHKSSDAAKNNLQYQ